MLEATRAIIRSGQLLDPTPRHGARRAGLAVAAMLTALALLLSLPGPSQATELEIALSDEMVEGVLSSQTTRTANQGVQFGGGLLYNDDSDLLGTLFLQINNRSERRWQPLTFGLGPRVWAASLDEPDEKVIALAVGGHVGVGIPARIPLALVFQGHVSPNITTSGDARRITEAMVRFDAEIVRGAHAFVGFRQIKVRSEDFRDVKLDDGFHVGIRLRF